MGQRVLAFSYRVCRGDRCGQFEFTGCGVYGALVQGVVACGDVGGDGLGVR
ncbi:hypothetical protein ACE6JH_00025 [Streptomyces nigra]